MSVFEKYKNLIFLAVLTIATTVAVWAPFFFRLENVWGIKLPNSGMATVVSNYDGPFYLVAAKSLYDPEVIKNDFPFSLDPIYYSAHYPLYPLLIRGVATAFPFLGYPYSMILVTVLTSVFAVWIFYLLLIELNLKKYALVLAAIFTVFPARWLVVKSVGSPEPLFIATLLASLYFFLKEKWWLSGLFGALAQATKAPGILLFVSYLVTLVANNWSKLAHVDSARWLKNFPWRAYPILLIPLTLLSIYIFYGQRYGNFFAYFNSGDNIHLMFPPFQVFNPGQTWVGTFWLEEIIWLYLFGFLGVISLFRQRLTALGSFAGIFFLSLIFVSHRDIARYALPLVPLLIIAWAKVLASKEFKWALLFLLIPIYLFALAFIANNMTPIGDWSSLL